MSEQFRPNQDAIDLSWEAAQAANRAHDDNKDAREAYFAAITVSDLEVDGIEVSKEAISTLRNQVTNTFSNHNMLVNMASIAIRYDRNPFNVIPTETIEDQPEAEALASDAKEAILKQLQFATTVCNNLTVDLNANLPKKAKKLEIMERVQVGIEFQEWFTDAKQAQVAARQEANPNAHFTLVARPNVVVPKAVFKGAAKAFGEDQPYETYIYDPLYDKYSDEELSGTDPSNGNAVKFSLIESTFAPELEGTVPQQRAKLAELQAQYPDVGVPSPVEALAYWHTLRVQGVQLKGDEVFDLTYIRHFDMDEKRFDGYSCVPRSCVDDGGRAYLGDSSVRDDSRGRVLVG